MSDFDWAYAANSIAWFLAGAGFGPLIQNLWRKVRRKEHND